MCKPADVTSVREIDLILVMRARDGASARTLTSLTFVQKIVFIGLRARARLRVHMHVHM